METTKVAKLLSAPSNFGRQVEITRRLMPARPNILPCTAPPWGFPSSYPSCVSLNFKDFSGSRSAVVEVVQYSIGFLFSVKVESKTGAKIKMKGEAFKPFNLTIEVRVRYYTATFFSFFKKYWESLDEEQDDDSVGKTLAFSLIATLHLPTRLSKLRQSV